MSARAQWVSKVVPRKARVKQQQQQPVWIRCVRGAHIPGMRVKQSVEAGLFDGHSLLGYHSLSANTANPQSLNPAHPPTDVAYSTLTQPSAATTSNTALYIESSARGRSLRAFEPRRGRDSVVGSPSRGNLSSTQNSSEDGGVPGPTGTENEPRGDLLEDDTILNQNETALLRQLLHSEISTLPASRYTNRGTRLTRSEIAARDRSYRSDWDMSGPFRRAKTRSYQGQEDEKDLLDALRKHGAQTAIMYHTAEPNQAANDIWPNFRSKAKLPARYTILDIDQDMATSKLSTILDLDLDVEVTGESSQEDSQTRYNLRSQKDVLDAPSLAVQPTVAPCTGRPLWKLPVELVEQIITHLNRDDIKSLRLVSRELNTFTSQAAFKTVVVPFNTEIYGMLGQEPIVDRKGKKRAKISRPEYLWRNANGDEVYNGHGLDVFRGFGQHIVRFGMSFEISEESLSSPPLKSMTEEKTSFWGNYDWPYEEYRRFDAVAGLESAADETPRMKIAFSELKKVRELALSVDSGLGWLNGPDRSIRARILHTAPHIFGSNRTVPDRRTEAQRELWNHIETTYSRTGEDIRLALLCRLEGARPIPEPQILKPIAATQPESPYIESRLLCEALSYASSSSHNSEDIDISDGHTIGSPPTKAGVLFTSALPHHDHDFREHEVSPITPANLSKAQKEWLLETEWAQRAFMSSYMLAIIDNRDTFKSIHSLNIASLSDRYISMLNRNDFWDALPTLTSVTLIIKPGWRTVEKDEAGFVDTSRVDPTDQVDTFCALLNTQIAPRKNIVKLTIGYDASGEHAEGLHARNKLLMPAPVLPLRASLDLDTTLPSVETATLQDAKMLQQVIVRFSHLEELTLRNCWITPSSLLQFVWLHDECKLEHLSLESVSLTAILRAAGNAQAANVGQNAGAGHVAPQALWNHANNNLAANFAAAHQHLMGVGPALNNHIQTLIAQLQQIQANAGNNQVHHQAHALHAQLQTQIQNAQPPNAQQQQGNGQNLTQHPPQQNQQAQLTLAQTLQLTQIALQANALQQIAGQNVPAAAAPANAAGDDGNANSVLQGKPREGSWMDIIDQISPGTNLSSFDSPHSKANPDRITALDCVSFVSCGYAKLCHLNVDQSAIEARNDIAGSLRHAVFAKRHTALSALMMSSKWAHLGDIVQEVDATELAVLDAAWDLQSGWADAEAARAVEFDGLLPGGTGRFSGKVQRSDRVRSEVESDS